MVRPEIDCPGDTITYNCSILSNTETIHLIWRVTFPGLSPVNITYDSSSTLYNTDNLPMNLSAILTKYRNEECIESLIVLTVLRNVTMNNTKVECIIADLDYETTIVFVNTSGLTIIIISEQPYCLRNMHGTGNSC